MEPSVAIVNIVKIGNKGNISKHHGLKVEQVKMVNKVNKVHIIIMVNICNVVVYATRSTG